ncbi:MAG: hypothetical protein H6R00_4560 [Proteobacteria bacterium]|nr:hypothetical protein [Pseudomonadota bacterium]
MCRSMQNKEQVVGGTETRIEKDRPVGAASLSHLGVRRNYQPINALLSA